MRKIVCTMVLIGLLCVPVVAQFQFGRGMMGGSFTDANALLGDPGVQKALKLTEEQKKTVTDARSAQFTALMEAAKEGDKEGIKKAADDFTKVMTKLKESLTSEQRKRLAQLEVQAAVQNTEPAFFKREDIQKALKLTDKQATLVKDTLADIEKDRTELFEDAKGDKEKFQSLRTKIGELNKEGFNKISKTLTDEQKKIWTDMQGEKYEGKLGGFNFGGKGKGKGKKKDDF